MSFLAPLYLLAAMAIGLPIAFHMLRRTPRGRVPFSSLMFLAPSPPRVTRRSRLDEFLLLLLRAAAVILLALAFARPLLRWALAQSIPQVPGQSIVVLVDTSASMRREALWTAAQDRLAQIAQSLSPHDRVALAGFDDEVAWQLDFDDWSTAPAASRPALITQAGRRLAPSWRGTNLAAALITAVERLHDVAPSQRPRQDDQPPRPGGDDRTAPVDSNRAMAEESLARDSRRIVLLTDLQEGSQWESLRTFQWPDDVLLELMPLAPEQPGNAALQAVVDQQAPWHPGLATGPRVRVVNSSDSPSDRLSLTWEGQPLPHAPAALPGSTASESSATSSSPESSSTPAAPANTVPEKAPPRSPPTGDEESSRTAESAETPDSATAEQLAVHLPAGKSRVVQMTPATTPRAEYRLRLEGDSQPFDNLLYLAVPTVRQVQVAFWGDDAADDPKQLLYYLRRAFVDTPWSQVRVAAHSGSGPLLPADLDRLDLVVTGGAVAESRTASLRSYLNSGGRAVWVLRSTAAAEAGAEAAALGRLLDTPPPEISEASVGDYALWTNIDFEHPLFAPLADPRFSDFTRLFFWHHRRIAWPTSSQAKVLARFDDGDPALLEIAVQKGTLWILTSGWHGADSQLALSTKFVPLWYGFLGERALSTAPPVRTVGSETSGAVERAAPAGTDSPPTASAAPTPSGRATITAPSGQTQELEMVDRRWRFVPLEPGHYRLDWGDRQEWIAVNLPPAESRTTALDAEELASLGIRLAESGTPPSLTERAEALRLARVAELESRQKMWQWLLAVVLVLCIVETWWATRRSQAAQSLEGVPA